MTAEQTATALTQITTSSQAHDLLNGLFITSPLVYRDSGYYPAPDGLFGYSDHADFPDIFPLVNEGPFVFMGVVWRAAPAGYDVTKPTLHGVRYYDLDTVALIAKIDSLYDGLRALGK